MRRWIGFAWVLALLGTTTASALEMTARVDNTRPRQGEQIVLEVVITGSVRNPGEPTLPELEPDFRVFSSGSSRNISIVNGKMTSSITYTYVLIPQKQGTLHIGRVTLNRKDEVLRTDPITINVGSPGQPPQGVDPATSSGNDEIFVRGRVDKRTVYVGEQITLRLQLYTRIQLLETPSIGAPDMDGFWREDLPGVRPRITTVSGQQYRLIEVPVALFPTRSGDLTIGASEIVATIREKRNRRDPFSVFGSIFDGKRLTLQTKPIPVKVLPLPEGAPLGFTGAVGDYVLDVSCEPTTVEQGNPIQLLFTLSGKGNLRSLSEIPLPDMPSYRVYPETPQVSTSNQGTEVTGTLTQKVLLVPLTAGEQDIPVVRVPTFSPRSKTYKTLETRPISITVTPGSVSSDPLAGSGRQGIEVLGSDIRFIETETPVFRNVNAGSGPLFGLTLLPVPLALLGGVWWLDRRRRRLDANVALKRKSRAHKTAMKRLDQLGRDGRNDLAGEAVSVLHHYLGDRWNLRGAGLTQDAIGERLHREGIDAGPFLEFLAGCDAARFAPGEGAGQGRRMIDEVREWIRRLEQEQ